MSIHISSSIACLSLALGLTAQPGFAMDNALIQEWAKQKAGSQPRLMPEVQKARPVTKESINVAENATGQPAAAAPVNTKGVTTCSSNQGLDEYAGFRCGAFGQELLTVKSLYAKGWRITQTWVWRDRLQFIAEER